jgi:hypothetical protein
MTMSDRNVRHILSLSGGKDSTALAIYLRDRIDNLEYVFCDTEKELPETYEYLDRLEAYLGRPIVRLKHDGRGFDHHLLIRGGYLPSPRMRWCTEELKIKPYERYIGDDRIISYIGIRADEDRQGYISRKPNIRARCPFKEDGLRRADVIRLLESSGLGLPSYYSWRSRSGCYFCFYQQRIEWVGLLENHPDLFEQSKDYEKCGGDKDFTWVQGESLDELQQPERITAIKKEHARRMAVQQRNLPNQSLAALFTDTVDAWQDSVGCTVCEI